jgi:dihydrofolate synthase/folylpolyglutamate synthase
MEPKNLAEWLAYLEEIIPQSDIRLGLDTVKYVGKKIDVLNQNAFVYTVAGTNGKGSTVAILEAILLEAGYNVGSYTSPHIESFNERIKINGVNVTDDLICKSFEYIEKTKGVNNLSYFEFITVAAFHCLAQHNLDVIILEIGLGGRLDAVNAIDPDVSIITSIALDHQNFLGDTEEKIAYEKAGILRYKKPLVYGATDMYASILDQSGLKQVPVYSKGNSFYFTTNDNDDNLWNWHGLTSQGKELLITSMPLPNNLVLDNAATAIQALQLFTDKIPIKAIKQGLTQVNILGRCQKLVVKYKTKIIEVILDVAHNPQAVEYFIKQVNRSKKDNINTNIVFAVYKDKNYKEMLAALKKIATKFFVTSAGHDRSLSVDDLSDHLLELSINNSKHSSIADALASAIMSMDTNKQPLIIVGSFPLIEAAIKFFKNNCSCVHTSAKSNSDLIHEPAT